MEVAFVVTPKITLKELQKLYEMARRQPMSTSEYELLERIRKELES